MTKNTETLPAHAQRALEEARLRRIKQDQETKPPQKEIRGRKGLDPVRYGDWEKKGIAIDF